ncbi:hypothetical protein NLG97_g10396 [Lecanicillium saksenae]|uniref:Uncharacterized protein n=1 Tax=Lecanicillium saksenae TaxID=468837 RepID=A0ACC1QDB6_9HYPO|nr:hypothetical protein NLG97_g10396 [Lecanicillium saksenae]
MLCSNRAESFSTHSSLSSPIPTSCFVDVILVPLPIWIAMVVVTALLLVPKQLLAGAFAAEPPRLQRPAALYRIVAGIYYVLIICNILMHTLEIVRLSLIHFGIGLLPFVYVGLLLGAALHLSKGAAGKVPAWLPANMVVWLGGMAMSIVKVVGLDGEPDLRKGSKYPMSDQILDVAVIAGVYGVVAALELVTWIWRRQNSRKHK